MLAAYSRTTTKSRSDVATCRVCNIDKSINDFYRWHRMANGRRSECRDCMRQRAKERRTRAKGGGRVSPPFVDAQAALTWLVVEGYARVARDDNGKIIVTLPGGVETISRFNETDDESVETFSAFQQKAVRNQGEASAARDDDRVETRATFQHGAQVVPDAVAANATKRDDSSMMSSACAVVDDRDLRARVREETSTKNLILVTSSTDVTNGEEDKTLRTRRTRTCKAIDSRNDTCTSKQTSNVELAIEKSKRNDAAVARVFEHWRELWKRSPRCKLDKKRRMVIARALDEYGEEFVIDALTGYTFSLHHTGHNERATVYDEIALHLRDAEHIEAGHRFLERRTTPIRSAKEVSRAIRNADAMAWARDADAEEESR